jgi:hypothetical protein
VSPLPTRMTDHWTIQPGAAPMTLFGLLGFYLVEYVGVGFLLPLR